MEAVETLLLDIRDEAGQRVPDEARLLIGRMAGVVLYQADDAWRRTPSSILRHAARASRRPAFLVGYAHEEQSSRTKTKP